MPHGVMALTRKYKSCLHFEISKSDSKLGRATWLPHLIKMTRMRFCVYQMMVAYCLLSWLLPECDDHVNIFKFPNPPSFDIIMTMVTRNRFKRK